MTHLIGYYEQSSPCTYNMSKHPTPESNIRNLYSSVKDEDKIHTHNNSNDEEIMDVL